MAEVLAKFPDVLIQDDEGFRYLAQACGAPNGGGLWEGWIEFLPTDGGAAMRSPRETTQPNRTDAAYWATGLTATYLEGAFERASRPLVRRVVDEPRALFDGPAPSHIVEDDTRGAPHAAVMDPFSVYEKGEGMLRQQLHALSAMHLVNIVLAYELSEEPVEVLNEMPGPALVELIVQQVRKQAARR